MVVTAGEGSRFPTVPFNATIFPAATTPLPSAAEVVRVTARSTDTLTLTRAQEGSSARAIIVGDQIVAGPTVKAITDLEAWASAISTGTTISGLGTAADGKMGLIRAGSTPFDFITVVYDATYGKWVSQAFITGSCDDKSGSTDRATGTGYGYANMGFINEFQYKPYADAGLTLQVRAFPWLSSSVTDGTMYAQVEVDLHDYNSDGGGSEGYIIGEVSIAGSTSTKLLSIDWTSLTGVTTIRRVFATFFNVKKVGGTGTSRVSGWSAIHSRWVA